MHMTYSKGISQDDNVFYWFEVSGLVGCCGSSAHDTKTFVTPTRDSQKSTQFERLRNFSRRLLSFPFLIFVQPQRYLDIHAVSIFSR